MSVTLADVDTPAMSGRLRDATSATTATAVQMVRPRALRRSRSASNPHPRSDVITLAPIT